MPNSVFEVQKFGARYRVLEVSAQAGPADVPRVVADFDTYDAAQRWVERTVLGRRPRWATGSRLA
ncbi:MAG: hypothetical protein AAFV45_09805 [Pseudomonadota bacterium]